MMRLLRIFNWPTMQFLHQNKFWITTRFLLQEWKLKEHVFTSEAWVERMSKFTNIRSWGQFFELLSTTYTCISRVESVATFICDLSFGKRHNDTNFSLFSISFGVTINNRNIFENESHFNILKVSHEKKPLYS